MNKSKCGQNGLLHWQITREEYERLDESYKNCGIVFFVKENKDSNTGVIIRNGIQFAGGSGGGDVDWAEIQRLITHEVGKEITELREEISQKMNELSEAFDNKIKELTEKIEAIKIPTDYIRGIDVVAMQALTQEAYDALGDKSEKTVYIIKDETV